VRNLFTASDQVTFTHGRHSFDFGLWFQRLQANDNLIQDQFGQASFTNLQTFLQGKVSTYTYAPSFTPLSWRSIEGAFYAEDAIKLKPSVELRIGFRGEFTNGWNEAHGRASNYAFDAAGVIVYAAGRGQFPVHRQQSEVPARTAHLHRMVSVRIKEDGDSGGRRSVLRAARQSELSSRPERPLQHSLCRQEYCVFKHRSGRGVRGCENNPERRTAGPPDTDGGILDLES